MSASALFLKYVMTDLQQLDQIFEKRRRYTAGYLKLLLIINEVVTNKYS